MLIVIANFCYTHKDIHVGCSQTSINIFAHSNELTQQRMFGNREPVAATGVEAKGLINCFGFYLLLVIRAHRYLQIVRLRVE